MAIQVRPSHQDESARYMFFLLASFLLVSLLLSTGVRAGDSCTGNSNSATCDGPYGLTWTAYTVASNPGPYVVEALTNIAQAFALEPVGYRVPTLKELITVMGYDGTLYPTVASWLPSSGYLISSTSGRESGGVKKIMAIDIATKAVIELPMTGIGGEEYFLIAVK